MSGLIPMFEREIQLIMCVNNIAVSAMFYPDRRVIHVLFLDLFTN